MLSNRLDPHLPSAAIEVPRQNQTGVLGRRALAEECPVALVYDGTTIAVVMATPVDLADLAVGFSLTEGIISEAAEIEDLDVVPGCDGIELRIWLASGSGRRFKNRQRRLMGPTGCGLCGIESLAEATRALPKLRREISLSPVQISSAIDALSAAQILNQATRATHAAAFYTPDDGLVFSREDVGRHNALDKLAGALTAHAIRGGAGAVILTSRVSVEMVQKTAVVGACVLVAISAPTALAVRTADSYGITLVGIVRGAEFEVFSHPDGITSDF